MDDRKIIFIEVRALLVMLGNPKVVPLLFVYGFLMFLPSGFVGAACLAHVHSFFTALTHIFVNSSLFLTRGLRRVFAAEYIFELWSGEESSVDSSVGESAFKLMGNAGYVRYACVHDILFVIVGA